MTENLVRAGSEHVRDVQNINQELIEKTLRMRCLAYMHEVKSDLLTQTIYSISNSKKEMERLTADLSLRTDVLMQQRELISHQRDELHRRNQQLEQARATLEEQVAERTESLRERIREEAHIQRALRESEARYRDYAKLFQTSAEGLMITDADANIIEVNPALTHLTGFSDTMVLGQKARFLFGGDQTSPFLRVLSQTLDSQGEWQGELPVRRRSGKTLPAWVTITAVSAEEDNAKRYVGVFSDISKIKESEARLHHMAHHDALTDLPNRLLFHARLEHALSRAQREGTGIAVLFFDLDGFKSINDSFGHPIGDLLLTQVGERLRDCVRDEDTVSRLSGDEFTVILEDVEQATGPHNVAKKLLDLLHEPFDLEGKEILISASLGISLYPQDGADVTTLVRNADVAMYRAKELGRDRFEFYKQEMTEHVSQRLNLETNLRWAVQRGELLLHYQPQFDLISGRLTCLEALIRWRHPEMGVIEPSRFIPLAEESGLIEIIGSWVIDQACVDIAGWREAGLMPARIALNLSTRQLAMENLLESIDRQLEQSCLDPTQLELELTETALMARPEQHISTLNALKDRGIGLAIDDFGTGYSSLAYLKRFPVDRLKIDHSFIRGVPHDGNDTAIIEAILAMSRKLNIQVVAEGVETEAQRAFLKNVGCTQAQGFLLGVPMSAQASESLLAQHAAVAVP